MNDQQKHWNNNHSQRLNLSTGTSSFAKKVLKIIPNNSKILELGCGVGMDAAAFASAGHSVLATDFSDIAIAKNRFNYSSVTNLKFETLDIQNIAHFLENEFDLVYARLSLHYFSDLATRQIFSDIHRIIRPDGYFCFVCKSTKDPLYGKGRKLEENMYQDTDHVRHFFDKKYTESLLKNVFSIYRLLEGEEIFYGKKSAFISVIARVKK